MSSRGPGRPIHPVRCRTAHLQHVLGVLALALVWSACRTVLVAADTERLRVVIETDAGGDPDDEQSLVRFLLYANEWDVEGIIANRPRARDGENRNPERTGLGIVRRLLNAYGECWPQLVRHDERYPGKSVLWDRTVSGDAASEAGVNLLLTALERDDPRPLWYADWGTDAGAATNNLRRLLDRLHRERDPATYARLKSRLRLSSADKFGPHTTEHWPPFPLWVDTFRPERQGRRWYHRFSALTATAGGFDLVRDVLQGHGPLGALYPTNTTHWAKEGDSATFLYWVPNGLNVPDQPTWGGWPGRYGPNETLPGRPYFWANQEDEWEGTTHRDATLARWAAALQNDFRARLDWCVRSPAEANHPPRVQLDSESRITLIPGDTLRISAAGSSDPDGHPLQFRWEWYREPGSYRGPLEWTNDAPEVIRFRAPTVDTVETLHFVVSVTDAGDPPLTRYGRVVVTVNPVPFPKPFELAFRPPPEGLARAEALPSFLRGSDGSPVATPEEWRRRRGEILADWHRLMAPWPPMLREPTLEVLTSEPRETFVQQRVRIPIAADRSAEGWLLIPARTGPLPAVVVPFYDPETSVGLGNRRGRDLALQLTRHGFVTLSLGSPGGDARRPDLGSATCQPLSYLAYVAANAHTALTRLPGVDPRRIGIAGHSYGGKWALFAAALHEPFAACAVSDPGVSWDESRANVNYWEPWYLGRESGRERTPGLVTPANPRTGAYRELLAGGHTLAELESLLVPRPFLVSGGSEDPPERWADLAPLVALNERLGYRNRIGLTSRPGHDPTPESNAALVEFFVRFLGNPE